MYLEILACKLFPTRRRRGALTQKAIKGWYYFNIHQNFTLDRYFDAQLNGGILASVGFNQNELQRRKAELIFY